VSRILPPGLRSCPPGACYVLDEPALRLRSLLRAIAAYSDESNVASNRSGAQESLRNRHAPFEHTDQNDRLTGEVAGDLMANAFTPSAIFSREMSYFHVLWHCGKGIVSKKPLATSR